MNRKSFLLIAVVMTFLLPSPSVTFAGYLLKDVTYPELGLRFKMPSDWQHKSELLGNRDRLIICSPKSVPRGQHVTASGLTFGIYVVSEQFSQTNELSQWENAARAFSAKLFNLQSVVVSFDQGNRKINGPKHVVQDVHLFRGTTSLLRKPVGLYGAIIAQSNDKGYRMHAACFLNNMRKHDYLTEHMMDDMLKSVFFRD